MKKLDKLFSFTNNILSKMANIKNIEYILLSLVLLSTIVVRLYKINSPIADWHSFRQADTASVTRTFRKDGINLLYPKYHDISTTQSGLFNPEGYRYVEVPIFNVIHLGVFSSLPFDFDTSGRLAAILIATISTVFVYLLGKRFIGKWGGLLAGFLYATLPFNIYFTRVVLPEPLAVTLGLASLYLFIKYLDNDDLKLLTSSAIVFSIAILVKPFVIFYGVPMVLLAVRQSKLKQVIKSKRYISFTLISLVPFVLWRFWIQQFPEGIPFYKWTLNGDGIRFRPAFWFWIFGERLTKLILGYWGLVPFVFGLLAFRKRLNFIHYFLFGMLLYVVVFATASVRHDYYQTIAVPAVVLATASGIVYLWSTKVFNRAFTRSLLVISLLIMYVTGASQVKEFYKINRPEIIDAGLAVQKITPEDSLVIAPYNGDTAFLYQTNRTGWPVVDRPIGELVERGAQYFVSVDLDHYQTVEFSERFKVVEKTEAYVIINLQEDN